MYKYINLNTIQEKNVSNKNPRLTVIKQNKFGKHEDIQSLFILGLRKASVRLEIRYWLIHYHCVLHWRRTKRTVGVAWLGSQCTDTRRACRSLRAEERYERARTRKRIHEHKNVLFQLWIQSYINWTPQIQLCFDNNRKYPFYLQKLVMCRM